VDQAQRDAYANETRLLIDTLAVLGLAVQLSLSFTLAPRGSKSKPINTTWVIGTLVLMVSVRCFDLLELRGVCLGTGGAFILCLTRLQRAFATARGTPSNARAWLRLGRGIYGTFTKSVPTTLLQGALLAMMSVGAPIAMQVAMLMIPEACRMTILLQAALCARELKSDGGRALLMSAMAQAFIGCTTYTMGVAACVWHTRAYM